MCTAISWKNKDSYFGRNLDLERGYGESVVITPRNFKLNMRLENDLDNHYAMIGMGTVTDQFPLYFDATNEMGVSMAGLHFPDNAYYEEPQKESDRKQITPFELIPWVLGRCANLTEVRELLNQMRLVNVNFSKRLPLSPLHWMISDKEESIVLESMREGMRIYENPYQVLTNNPPFAKQQTFIKKDMDLPGDFSSTSRFLKAYYVKENSVAEETEMSSVNQFFHILNAVSVPKGCSITEDGYKYTRYSSCCNASKGIYYYQTYDNFEILSVNMHDADLDGSQLSVTKTVYSL